MEGGGGGQLEPIPLRTPPPHICQEFRDFGDLLGGPGGGWGGHRGEGGVRHLRTVCSPDSLTHAAEP